MTRTIPIKVYGKWFYQTHGMAVTDHAPVQGWEQKHIEPGQFQDLTPTDEERARSVGADVVLIGRGLTMDLYRVEQSETPRSSTTGDPKIVA